MYGIIYYDREYVGSNIKLTLAIPELYVFYIDYRDFW